MRLASRSYVRAKKKPAHAAAAAMSLAVRPRRKRPVGGTITLMHLSDDNLRSLFALIEMPLALKLTCVALRNLHPEETKTCVKDVVHDVGLMVWAHACGLFEHMSAETVAKHAAMTWPGGDEALSYMASPLLYGHELDYCTDPYALCPHAASVGSTRMLEWLGYGTEISSSAALVAAVGNNQFECLKWMHRQCTGPDAPEKFANPVLLDAVAGVDNLEMAQWLLDRGSPRDNIHAMIAAARNGRVELLDLLCRSGFQWCLACFYSSMSPIDRKVKILPLSTVQYLVTKGLAWDRKVTWREAISGTHVETLRWLVVSDPDGAKFDFDDDHPLWSAAEKGSIEVLTIAADNGAILEPELCDNAVYGGQIETLKWLHSKGVTGTPEACWYAVQRGNVEVLDYLRDHGGYPFKEETGDGRIFCAAAEKGSVEAADWLLDAGVQLPTCADERKALFEMAMDGEHCGMLSWLLAHKCGNLEEEHVRFALWHGQAKTLQWLMDNDCPIDFGDVRKRSWHDEFSEIGLILSCWMERNGVKKANQPGLQLLEPYSA